MKIACGIGSLFLALVVIVALSSGKASAATINNCSVSGVSFDLGQRLIINCNGTFHYAFATPSNNCVNTTTVETLRVWASQAQAALLSGKTLTMNFDVQPATCSGRAGAPTISLIWLNGS